MALWGIPVSLLLSTTQVFLVAVGLLVGRASVSRALFTVVRQVFVARLLFGLGAF